MPPFGVTSGCMTADKRYALALRLAEWGDFSASADLLRQGIELAPGWPPLHFHFGEALRQAKDYTGARHAFEEYLRLDPSDAMGAAIKLFLIGAAPAPPAMPEEYVRALFHQYAPQFEKSLVGNLAYRVPGEMAALVLAHRENGFSHILDLGCGTGLAAQFFQGRAAAITGVDLAPGMIREARAKNLYTALHEAKIEDFLAAAEDRYDLILAADLFVYIGEIAAIFKQVATVMTGGGLYCFSVQTPADGADGWILGPDHRYAHAHAYIARCIEESGLALVDHRAGVTLRLEGKKPVAGAIYLARKP
jgi:predicted TPR repeat methyltransferase